MDEARPLRVAVLTSRRAPGLDVVLDRSASGGASYRVVGVVSSEGEAGGLELAANRGIPVLVSDVDEFARRRSGRRGDLDLRPAFDRKTLEMLEPLRPDALLLCGYLLIVTDPLLSAFPSRIINVHDADLRLRGPSGGPRYPGLRATYDALAAGETETRSTVHLVTAAVDAGAPVAVSRSYPAAPLAGRAREWGDQAMLRAYAYAHREWMMKDCWGSLLDRGLETLAAWIRCRRSVATGGARDRLVSAGGAS